MWLPAGANAFNVLLVRRFFDSLPTETFEAGRIDGDGPFRLFRSIVLPMSKPILGVVSVFAIVNAYRDSPVAAARAPEPRPAAAVGATAGHRTVRPAEHSLRGAGHLDAHPGRHLPGLPAACFNAAAA